MKKLLLLIALFCTIIHTVGCGNSSALKGLVPVKGVVLYEGKPVPGGVVNFIPKDMSVESSGEKRPANAITNDTGQFTLMTLNKDDGAFPGDYIVTVTKMSKTDVSEEDVRRAMRGEIPMPERKPAEHLLPEKYSSKEETDLQVTVGPRGDTKVNINLL